MQKTLILLHLLLGGLLVSAKDRPNILWITSEDNSPHWLGCYGNPQAQTPHLDALAADGVAFDRAYSNAPVCAVARSTILMGIHAPTMGTQHMRSRHAIPPQWKSHAQHLREAGYYTSNNFKTDYNIHGDDAAHWHDSSKHAHYRNRPNADAPFFAIFNLHESHESSLFKNRPLNPRRLAPDDVVVPPYLPDLPEIRRDIARYHDRVTDMDARVGQILAGLENDGLADTTIVFYYADHGGVLPRDKRYLEDTGVRVPLIVRIPEKFHHLAPFQAGQRSAELVTFADLTPTLLSLAGIPVPDTMQGRPFLGAQRTPPPADAMAFLYADRFDEIYRMRRGITDGKWKYIRNFTPHLPLAPYSFYQFGQPGWGAYRQAWQNGRLEGYHRAQWERPAISEQLYHLEADPWEIHNLAGDAAHADRLAAMRERLQATMRDHHDTGVVPEPLFATIAGEATLPERVRHPDFPLAEITGLAFTASQADPANLPTLINAMESGHPAIRYWGALGIQILGKDAAPAAAALTARLEDAHAVVRITAAEALHASGNTETAEHHLLGALTHDLDPISTLHLLNALHHLDLIRKIPASDMQNLRQRSNYIKRILAESR